MSRVLSKNPVKPGRPRSLTQDQVIDAAIHLGLDGITMRQLAAALSVTIPTLYQYVADREEVIRLGTERILGAALLPEDGSQTWPEYVLQTAEALTRVMASDPKIMIHLLHGSGVTTEVIIAEHFFQALSRRGMTTDETEQLLEAVAIASYGTAVAIGRDDALKRASGSRQQAANGLAAVCDAQDLPLVRQSGYFAASRSHDAARLLRPVIEEIKRCRGE